MIVIAGPTASGKTALAVALAGALDGEVVSADSRQVYRDMNIGTGKDLLEYQLDDRSVPYHLIDIVAPGEEYNVYRYQQDFIEVYRDISNRNKQIILCGGTGMYLEAVLKGYKLIRVPEDKALRADLSERSTGELIDLLNSMRDLHNTTDITDRSRLIRAIEIDTFYREHDIKNNFPKIDARVYGIRTERQELRNRITRRLKERLDQGMVEEVRALNEKGINHEKLKYYGLEYKFVSMYLQGDLNYEEMFEQLNTAIHQFAKRQMTWFRRMERGGISINWIEGEQGTEAMKSAIFSTMHT